MNQKVDGERMKKGYKEKSYIIGWNIMYCYSCVFYL